MKADVTARLAHLPAFHPTALRLLTISTESRSAMAEFETCFNSDPAFASELLRSANSAEFGLRSEVESIRHALALLGLERVSSLAFTIAMEFYTRHTPRRQVIHPVWSHSVASGLISEALGAAFGAPLGSLYTAGLMHDLGRLGLLMAEPGKYEPILTQVYETLDESPELEIAATGVTHTEAGAWMAESWSIPAPICQCIRRHHDVPDGEPRFQQPVDLVRLACRMAVAFGYAELNCRNRESLDDVLRELPPAVRAHAALAPERISKRIKKTLGSVW